MDGALDAARQSPNFSLPLGRRERRVVRAAKEKEAERRRQWANATRVKVVVHSELDSDVWHLQLWFLMLEQQQLDRLHALWVERGAQIVDGLAPGLDPDAARRMVREHPPLELTDELALWFSWHDGAPADPRGWSSYSAGGPLESPPLAASLQHCADTGDLGYDEDWLPIFSGKNALKARCSPESPHESDIWVVRWSEEPRLILPSFGDLIDIAIELIELGAWTFHPGYPDSRIVDELVPRDIKELGFT